MSLIRKRLLSVLPNTLLVNEHRIDAGRVSTVGYGETRPVADNDTDAGRARNRRIEAALSVEVEERVRRE